MAQSSNLNLKKTKAWLFFIETDTLNVKYRFTLSTRLLCYKIDENDMFTKINAFDAIVFIKKQKVECVNIMVGMTVIPLEKRYSVIEQVYEMAVYKKFAIKRDRMFTRLEKLEKKQEKENILNTETPHGKLREIEEISEETLDTIMKMKNIVSPQLNIENVEKKKEKEEKPKLLTSMNAAVEALKNNAEFMENLKKQTEEKAQTIVKTLQENNIV